MKDNFPYWLAWGFIILFIVLSWLIISRAILLMKEQKNEKSCIETEISPKIKELNLIYSIEEIDSLITNKKEMEY